MTLQKSLPPMTVIAGPCVIEEEGWLLEVAQELKRLCQGLPIQLYFKASFDKANRSSVDSFRGPGLQQGLRILKRVREEIGLPVLTDFHTPDQAEIVAQNVDFMQVPAFLCRQTDMILAAAQAALDQGCRLNIKKGQFLSPWEVQNVVDKVRWVEHQWQRKHEKKLANDWFCMTERGSSFGYQTLVVDMIAFQCMQRMGVPVLFDATHSIQKPGQGPDGKTTGGQREYLEVLGRAAIAAGADGIFLECHPQPSQAKSDGANAFYLSLVGQWIQQLLALREVVAHQSKLLPEVQKALNEGRPQR